MTDANLILGRLPAESPIAADLRLDVEAARRALESLGIGSAEEAAEGVVAVAVNAMVQALRVVSVERGHDPAGASLLAFGGAGPLHACELATQLGATRVLCLPASGVLSAVGLAAAERRRDASRSLLQPLADAADLDRLVAELAGDGEEIRGAADLRYAGQSFELLIPFDDPAELEEAFHAEHERRYGHADRDRAVELVTLRAAAVAAGAEVTLTATGDVQRSRRTIRWEGSDLDAEVLTGDGLPPGTKVEGPAIVEFPETTCLDPARLGGRGRRARDPDRGGFVNRLIAVHAPATVIGDDLLILSVELWTGGVVVHFARVETEETDRLTAEYTAAMAAWARDDRDAANLPEQPVEGFGDGFALSDDVGTRFRRNSGHAGGTGAEWRGTWNFVPGVPEQATRLTLAAGDDALELEL